MIIYGWQKLTLQDFPGKVSTILFTKGCNFNCGYCHNKELIPSNGADAIPQKEVFRYLDEREGKVDGVVITGGEPTMQKDLLEFASELKRRGLAVKLDTNGSRPDIIRDGIARGLFDYVAMDYKFPAAHYTSIVNIAIDQEVIRQSRELLKESSIPHEFRVTLVENLFTDEVLRMMADELAGDSPVVLQSFSNENVNDPSFEAYPSTTYRFMEHAASILRESCASVNIRDA